MSTADTSIGGAGRAFPPTTQGLLGPLRDPSNPLHRQALTEFCSRYWKPVYHYLRIARAKSNDDAKDLTQAFFQELLEGDALSRYAPERGSFRTFLKVLLASFLSHHEEAMRALKRGGGVRTFSLDVVLPPGEDSAGVPQESDPERAFDQAWVTTVMQSAVERVRSRLSSQGREVQFRVFEEHDLLPDGEPPGYETLARRLGIKETQVRDHLVAVRRAVRSEIRAELATLTRDDRELQEEWNVLFGA